MADDKTLTRREMEILALLAEGMSNDEIAAALSISPNTVKVHLRNIFEKMGVQSRTEATMEAVRKGWISVPGMEPEHAAVDAVRNGLDELAWPPLEDGSGRWQTVVLAAVLVLAVLVVFWPESRPAVQPSVASRFTTESWLERSIPAPRHDAFGWSSLTAMPTARSRAATALIDGRLYVVGGETPTGDVANLEMYDPNNNTWQTLPPRPLAARGSGATSLGGKLYTVGGCEGPDVSAAVHRFEPASQAWQELSPYPYPTCGVTLVTAGDRILGMGGWDGTTVRDEVFVYDDETDLWTEAARLPAGRAFGSAVWLRDHVYYLGGHDGAAQTADMWVYDPLNDTWTAGPSLVEPRAGLAVGVENNSIYVFGGGEGNQTGLAERFDSTTGSWSTLDVPRPRPGPWHHAVGAMIGSYLHIVGGWGGDYLASHEAYQASYRIFLPIGSQGAQG